MCGNAIEYLKSIKRYASFLSERMKPLIQQQWDARHSQPKAKILFPHAVGIVDTTPACLVRRPKNKDWRTALYNGKYKAHVLKIQMVCSFPYFLTFDVCSGPHIGVRSGSRLYREKGPSLNPNETT